jgi:hypothetical protein
MEGLTDKLTNYQQIVQQLLMGYAEVKPAYGDIELRLFLIRSETTIKLCI